MASLDISAPASIFAPMHSRASNAELDQEPTRGVLVARLHTAYDGIPFYDAELQVAQSKAHRIMVVDTASVLSTLAPELELVFLADEPIWYLHPETDLQKVFYGDCVLGRPVVGGASPVDTRRITAESVVLVVEVVSTNDRRKELKDTRFQRLLNEYNGVPEFILAFPEPDDPRALTYCQLVNGEYQEQTMIPGATVLSRSVPGLELRVRARASWEPGRKFDILYKGEVRLPLDQERARAEHEKARAEHEKARAEKGEARAEKEKARADKLAERLRELGIDPDGP